MTESLPGSRFPELADAYCCDDCGRDITKHLHRGQAHVRQPIGLVRYVCICGKSYPTGATEWDHLSQWAKRQWLSDLRFAGLLFVLLLIPVGLGYAAWKRHSVMLLAVFLVVSIPVVVFLRLFGIMLLGFVDIAQSIWRTRVRSISKG